MESVVPYENVIDSPMHFDDGVSDVVKFDDVMMKTITSTVPSVTTSTSTISREISEPEARHVPLPSGFKTKVIARKFAAHVALIFEPQMTRAELPRGHRDEYAVRTLSRVTIGDFVARIAGFVEEPSSVLIGAILLSRVYAENPTLPFSTVNAHRMILIACIIGSKMCTDVPLSNSFWASQLKRVFNLDDINAMECEFVRILDYDLRFAEEDLHNMIEEALAKDKM